jgi:hypothetical protein
LGGFPDALVDQGMGYEIGGQVENSPTGLAPAIASTPSKFLAFSHSFSRIHTARFPSSTWRDIQSLDSKKKWQK